MNGTPLPHGLKVFPMTPHFLRLHNGPSAEAPHFACKNTLMIGCGGMGTSVVNCYKKRLQEYVDTRRFKAIRFLCTDTAQSDRGTQKSYIEEPTEILRVFSEKLIQIVDKLDHYPEISAWFRDDSLTETIKQEIYSSVDGSGTTRPFGRVSFFDKAKHIESVLKNLVKPPDVHDYRGLHGEVISVDSQSFHIYIVSSLCGGTGAGSFLDMAAMVRYLEKKAHTGKGGPWHIFGVFILPEIICADPRVTETNRLWANAYAALKELDHFLSGHPFEVKYRHWDETLRLCNKDYGDSLFNIAFLVDKTDSSELKTRDDVSDHVAEFLFYHTFTQGNLGYFNRYIDSRAMLDFCTPYPQTGESSHQHLTRYSALGVQTVLIPVNELAQFCTYRMALETFKHLSSTDPESVEERVEVLWSGSEGTGTQPLLKRLELDEARLHAKFGLRRDHRGEYALDGILNQYAVSCGAFMVAVRNQLAEGRQGWRRLWPRRIDVQALNGQLNAHFQNLNRIFTQFEEDPAFFPTTGGSGMEPGHREMGRYKLVIDQFRKQLFGDKFSKGNLHETFLSLLSSEQGGFEVVRELIFDVREHLQGYTLLPAESPRPLNLQLPQGIMNWQEIDNALQQIAVSTNGIISARLVRVARRKLALFAAEALKKLEDIERDISEISSHVRDVRTHLEARLVTVKFRDTVWSKSAVDRQKAEEIFRGYFLKKLPPVLYPKSLADTIRRDGLVIEVGGVKNNVCLEDYDAFPPGLLANGIIEYVSGKLDLVPPADSLLSDVARHGDHRDLWFINFASTRADQTDEIGPFTVSEGGADDIGRFAQLLITGASWQLAFDYPGGKIFSHCYSGSRAGSQDWSDRLATGVENLDVVNTLHYNQVTLVRSIHGIPVSTLGSLAKWKEVYELYLLQGWPLHLFRNAHDWQEPYVEPYSRERPEGLFEIAEKEGVIFPYPSKDGDTYDIVGIDGISQAVYSASTHMEEYKLASMFLSKHYQPQYISREELVDLIEKDHVLKETILREIKRRFSENPALDPQIRDTLIRTPFDLTREQIINASLVCDVLKKNLAGYLNLTIQVDRPGVDRLFFIPQYNRRYPNRDELIRLIRTSTVFYEYLLWEIIEVMMQRAETDQDYRKELIDQLDSYPADLRKELADFLK